MRCQVETKKVGRLPYHAAAKFLVESPVNKPKKERSLRQRCETHWDKIDDPPLAVGTRAYLLPAQL